VGIAERKKIKKRGKTANRYLELCVDVLKVLNAQTAALGANLFQLPRRLEVPTLVYTVPVLCAVMDLPYFYRTPTNPCFTGGKNRYDTVFACSLWGGS
jgi:hypothetical protein